MPREKKQPLHRAWNVAAHDGEGKGVDLRLAIEQTGERGFAAYAYWDRKLEDEKDEIIVASTDYAHTGPEAFHSLCHKLETDRGVTLEPGEPPDWLLTQEWEEAPPNDRDWNQEDQFA